MQLVSTSINTWRMISQKTEKAAALFEGMHIPTKEDWAALKEFVAEHGMYHSYRLCIAPTGSISYVQSATASVMPIMERIEERTYGNSKTYYPMPGLFSTKLVLL
ncbi:hypothetical protein BsIDN1_32130 [Bacillus safensis]|uniref:Ribonucleotide reductase large subunit domain-containing protein n=1 Tax=Bacillus safensis TaxID=561879 RepID=A0A5S9M9Q9_BACIA|nr:hypothetical protein BsIDN1_32130 [Bacillus safensis]